MGRAADVAGAALRRWQRLIVAAALGIALWVGLVVVPEDTGGAAFLPCVLLTAFALGLTTSTGSEAWQVGVGLAGGPLVLALWTAPRGDNDGLWLLWYPLLAALVLVLSLAALVAGTGLRRVRCRSPRS